MLDAIVIGAGISGLAAGYKLKKSDKSFLVLEASGRAGGLVGSKKDGSYQIELAPNTLLADTHTLALIKELGLEKEVVFPAAVSQNRFVFREGRIQALPSKPNKIFLSSYFSLGTKWKIIQSFFAKPSPCPATETLAETIQKQFGEEVVQYALAPFVVGVYGSVPERMLTSLSFQQIQQAVQEQGSIIKGMAKSMKGTARRQSINFKGGLQQLTDALASSLGESLSLNSKVTSIEKTDDGYQVDCTEGGVSNQFLAKRVIIATPIDKSAMVFQRISPKIAEKIALVDTATMYAVHSVWKRSSTSFPFNGFGCLHVPKEKKSAAGAIWVSSAFPHCAPEDEIMLGSFIIKPSSEPLLEGSMAIETVIEEQKSIYSFREFPVYTHCSIWKNGLPVFDEKMLALWSILDEELPEGIQVVSNWYKGVSLNDCLNKPLSLLEV